MPTNLRRPRPGSRECSAVAAPAPSLPSSPITTGSATWNAEGRRLTNTGGVHRTAAQAGAPVAPRHEGEDSWVAAVRDPGLAPLAHPDQGAHRDHVDGVSPFAWKGGRG
jgi:hypothetical protein